MMSPQASHSDLAPHRLKWTDLSVTADSLAIANAAQESPGWLVVVTDSTQTSLRLEREIPFFLAPDSPVVYFPDWETLPYDVFSPLSEIVSKRLRTLYQLQQPGRGVLIVSAPTLLQRLAPHAAVLSQCFELDVGDQLNLDSMRQRLDYLGYQSVSHVQQHGEFSIRGSILDLFPMGHGIPYRIELFDDEIESIRTFDVDSQCSIEKADAIRLFPAREFPMDEAGISRFRQQFLDRFPNSSNRNRLYQDVSRGIAPAGIEYYLPLFVEGTESLLDYLPEATFVLHGEVMPAIRRFLHQAQQRFEQRQGDLERPPLSLDEIFIDESALDRQLQTY